MLIIRGVEVTQGIQYYRADQHLTDPADRGPDNSLQLVANKAAWVRVYVESDSPGTIPNVTGTMNVDYGFLNTRAGQPGVMLSPVPPGQATAQFNPDYTMTRGAISQTLNFIIPPARMYGPLSLNIAVTGGNAGETATRIVSIWPALHQTLKLRGIMIGYNGPDPANPANNLTVPAPGLADLQNTAAWALRVMPVDANGLFEVASTITRNVPLTGTATNGGCASGWIALNSAIATTKAADGNHPGYLYYGLIAAGFPNQSNNGGCESSGVSSGFNGGQIPMAHEIGHACGRAHAPCGGVGTSADPNYPAYEPYDTPGARVASIGEFGLDITNGAVPTPTTGRDYMSYCGPGWISIYGHTALINNEALNPEYVALRRPWWHDYVRYDPWWWLHYKPDPPPYWIDPETIREFPPQMQKVITVIGVLHADERIEVLSVTRSEVVSTELKGRVTDLKAVLHGARSTELAAGAVVELPSHGGCGCKPCGDGPQRPALFQAFIADVAVGTALTISRGELTLWKRAAPKGKLTVSTPKLKQAGNSTLEVSWSASDAGATREAWIRVSADEGKTWRAAATGLEGKRAQLDVGHLPVGKLLMEVVVHDGFRSSVSKPVAFENPGAPPVPAILHPHEGRSLVEGETLYLWGSVAVQPGQNPDAFDYVWMLDGKPAGEGLHVFGTVPAAGKHRCELIVRSGSEQRLRSCTVQFTSVPSQHGKE
ncbi:hypothetical protein [Paraburkholderia azotifigens]|uniref:hypothetical protein n=1 Tax=Paraburkholderia azotifigens TaxID=2057004 RepID=UPI0038BC4A9E